MSRKYISIDFIIGVERKKTLRFIFYLLTYYFYEPSNDDSLTLNMRFS